MSHFYNVTSKLLFCFFISITSLLFAGNPEFEARRTAYIDNAINSSSGDAITIQAYRNVPVNMQALNNTLSTISTRSTVDFDIVKLVRVLMFSNGEYDSMILPVLRPIPFWLEKNENLREYWSENHMIMWMSSDWLLHQKYGKAIDSTLERRLRHYLKLKTIYGFYEYYSSTYAPYTLSGLLNLVDFAEDAEIKTFAALAAKRLLKDILFMTNDKGVFFPVAGRNYTGKYETAYGQNHNHLIYMLTGMGEVPSGVSHAGGFLASTTLNVDDVIASWTANANTTFTLGHTLLDGVNNINSAMAQKDKVIFQWSSGAYFHPDVAISTFQLIKDLNLWGHFQFDEFRDFSFLPTNLAPVAAEIASSISKSSGNYNPTIAVFKNKSVVLSSIQDFWKGKQGYQQFPIMVNTGTSAVYTLSGKPTPNWEERPDRNMNIHLPYVKQTDNIALVMYRPEKGLALFGHTGDKLNVALHWQSSKFDEERESGNWILGREGNSYVAVRRHCVGDINGVKACGNPDGQTWVYMVGNSDMYGSFDQFQQKVEQSQYQERWYFNLPTLQWVYYAKVVIDGKTLEYAWNGNLISGPTQTPTALINSRNESKPLTVFPNPAKDYITVSIPMLKQASTLRILDIQGSIVFSESISSFSPEQKIINTNTLASGIYMVLLESNDEIYTQKIVIE